MSTPQELIGAVRQRLETDLLLGAKAVPLQPGAGTSRLAAPGTGATPPTAAGPPTGAPVVQSTTSAPHLQALSLEEIARRKQQLEALDAERVRVCTRCQLSRTRIKTVFGQGHPAARLVFVGEAPGHDEDLQGLAFVGRAGQLLTDMIDAMGLTRDEVFICNILKCRPPNNRDPVLGEISACWPYLDEQLRIIAPEVIVALGKPASQTLLRTTESIGRLRGRWQQYYTSGSPLVGDPTPLMPTFHPAYLLRSPGEKGKAWSDLKLVMQQLGLPVLPVKRKPRN